MSDYPTVRPSLNLEFARTKKLDPRITFRRASTGTYVDSDGLIKTAGINTPRFDHDPVTGVCKGLLVEESRTNLNGYSEQFGSWSLNGLTVAQEVLAGPKGVTAYDRLTLSTFTSSRGTARYALGGSISPGSTYTRSVYLKAGTCRYAAIVTQYSSSASVYHYFDLLQGTAYYDSLSPVAKSIVSVGNGWWRCSVSITDVGPGGSGAILIMPLTEPLPPFDGGGNRLYNSTGQYLYAYGAQTELGSFPTSYIPTTASTVTRSVDSALITGPDFNNFYRANAGSLFASFSYPFESSLSNSKGAVMFATNSAAPVIGFTGRTSDIQIAARGVGGGGVSVLLPPVAAAANTLNRIVLAYTVNSNDRAVVEAGCLNGSSVLTNSVPTANAMSGINSLLLGRQVISGDTTGGAVHLQRIAYWPKRLPDAQLQALTRR